MRELFEAGHGCCVPGHRARQADLAREVLGEHRHRGLGWGWADAAAAERMEQWMDG